jgi:hypothetical protein
MAPPKRCPDTKRAFFRKLLSRALSNKFKLTHWSVHPKGGLERRQQRCVAEGLEKAFHGTLFEQTWTDGLISVSSDEDDRNFLPAAG